MLKKILSLLLCSVMLLSLAACGPTEDPSGTNTAGSDAPSGTEGGNDASSDDKKEGDLVVYDPDIDHLFLATDICNHSIVLYDLDRCEDVYENLLTDKCVVWEWDADEDPNCKGNVGAGIDAAKYRYSPYYEKDVIIACSSSGWAGVIDYEEKTVLWEYAIGSGPHSIEMMPNGDVVVACSGGEFEGKLSYVPLSAGATKPSHEIFCPSGHGVSYDPVNECLWVLEFEQVFAVNVQGYGTAKAKLVRLNGTGYDFGASKEDTSGHVLSPKYGEPGKYWVAGGKLWIFDTATEELSKVYPHSSAYNHKSANWMKGVAYFEDGTMIQTVPGSGGDTTYDWSCGGFRITVLEESTGKVKKAVAKTHEIYFEKTDREFYKVHPFNKNYQ